jgi:hypothetical protein
MKDMHKQQGISSLVKIKRQLFPVCLMLLLCATFIIDWPFSAVIVVSWAVIIVTVLHQKSKIISCFKFVFTSINLTFIISWIIILSETSTMTFAEFNSAGGMYTGRGIRSR